MLIVESPPPPILNPTRIPVQIKGRVKLLLYDYRNEPVLDKREFLQ